MDKDDYIIKIEETTKDYLSQLEKPIILEFGVRHGLSTKLFLDTCEKNDGFLYSVDIDDNSKSDIDWGINHVCPKTTSYDLLGMGWVNSF